MLLFQFTNWSDISIFTILDFTIVGIFIFIFFRAVKGTPAIHILIALLICSSFYFLTKQFDMPLLRLIFKTIIPASLIGLIVVFQPELRKFLINFGKNSPVGKNGFITKFLKSGTIENDEIFENTAEQIGKCLVYCVANKLGALIILLPNDTVEYTIDSGVKINGIVNSKLLESIFEKQSPLHDGAVVVQGDQILSARVVMPISDNTNIPVRIGLRHRAAIGATEHHDVLAIIVSEEKNTISYAYDGILQENQTLESMKKKIVEVMKG
jgi:diadenylate cyclase